MRAPHQVITLRAEEACGFWLYGDATSLWLPDHTCKSIWRPARQLHIVFNANYAIAGVSILRCKISMVIMGKTVSAWQRSRAQRVSITDVQCCAATQSWLARWWTHLTALKVIAVMPPIIGIKAVSGI